MKALFTFLFSLLINASFGQITNLKVEVWMKENLKVTHYRNGDSIHILNSDIKDRSGTYCNFGFDSGNVSTYGRLYSWYAIHNPAQLCPAGWHIPSQTEWMVLGSYLGGV